MNNNKAAVIIDGPEDVLNSKDVNNPIITDNKPPIIEYTTILCGLVDKFLAIAAGIINIPVINNYPTILIEIAMIGAIKIVNIALALSGFKPSASANSYFTVEANKGFQMNLRVNKINDPPIHIINKSLIETAKISPNNNPIISNLINVKKPITTSPTARDE